VSAGGDRTATLRIETPAGLPGLVDALAAMTPRSRVLAGGTDLVRQMTQDGHRPDIIVDLSGVRELRHIRQVGESLRLGATTTFAEIAGDPTVRRHATCLASAAASVGAVQTRNMATIGGNIGNASPCADSIPALLALEATVMVLDGHGETTERRLDRVLKGPGATALRHDEVITEIVVPVPGGERRSSYAKLGSRTMVSVARIGMALVVRLERGDGEETQPGTIAEARVGIGALGETAFRADDLEELLRGRPADEATRAALVDAGPVVARAAIPGRSSLPYKQEAIRGVATDAWDALGLGQATVSED